MSNTVKKYIDLFRQKNVPDGAIFEVEETGKFYTRKGHNWDEMTSVNFKDGVKGPTMSLYDLNQSSITNLGVRTEEEIRAKIELLDEWHKEKLNEHYMLLSNNLHYYTIFQHSSKAFSTSFGKSVVEVLLDFDKIYAIDLTEDKNGWEIWATLNEDNTTPEVFYLFPYDTGVCYYG